MSRAPLDTKPCATCGRSFAWRRKWAQCWDRVKYCSERCRRHQPSGVDDDLEQAILSLLSERRRGATICPSEVARRMHPDDWRPLMDRVRAAAARLAARDAIAILQRGRAVDPARARGPIRLGLRDQG